MAPPNQEGRSKERRRIEGRKVKWERQRPVATPKGARSLVVGARIWATEYHSGIRPGPGRAGAMSDNSQPENQNTSKFSLRGENFLLLQRIHSVNSVIGRIPVLAYHTFPKTPGGCLMIGCQQSSDRGKAKLHTHTHDLFGLVWLSLVLVRPPKDTVLIQ